MPEQELYHWGVKGMRWGVRRYQNKDGSLTPAGKKRYSDDPDRQSVDTAKINLRSAKREMRRAGNQYNVVSTKENWQRYQDARGNLKDARVSYDRSKLQYNTSKEVSRIRDKNVRFDNKSKHRLRLEEQYRELGMSKEEAQAAANNRIRTEKVLAASATVAVSACAAYVARNRIKDRTDGLIKAGDMLKRVEMQDTGGKLHDVFYVAKDKKDQTRYENLLGMARKNSTGHAYLMNLQAQGDVRVASKDRARKVFGDLYKNDPEFRKSVSNDVARHFAGRNRVKDINDLSDKNIKKMYDNFNANLVTMRGKGASEKFYSKLKSAGYGAIQDINDMKYSGYHAKNPLIVFDNSNKNIMVKSVKELTSPDMNKRGTKELLKATGETMAEDFLRKAGPLTAGALTVKTVTTYRSDPNDRFRNKNRRDG